jgi:hypothetical protein
MEGILVAYEFYARDDTGNAHLIGILPERRKDMERITEESIMNWIKKVLGVADIEKKIFINQVKIE